MTVYIVEGVGDDVVCLSLNAVTRLQRDLSSPGERWHIHVGYPCPIDAAARATPVEVPAELMPALRAASEGLGQIYPVSVFQKIMDEYENKAGAP